MPDSSIDLLTAVATSLSGTENMVVTQGGVTKRAQLSVLLSYVNANGLSLAQILANGNSTGGTPITSPSGSAALTVSDTSVIGAMYNSATNSISRVELYGDISRLKTHDLNTGQIHYFESNLSKNEVKHAILNEFNAPENQVNGNFKVNAGSGDTTFNANQTNITNEVYAASGQWGVETNDTTFRISNNPLATRKIELVSTKDFYIDTPGTYFYTGGAYFESNLGIDSIGAGILNIGATNASVINYGNASTIHNFLGTAIYELQVNSYVEDKLMTLNYGGSVASGIGVGFEIEENSVITGYFKTNAARNSFLLKAPASFESEFSLSALTANRTYTYQDKSGTIAHIDDIVFTDPSFESVISQLNNPPAHVSGERYLIGAAPTGAWSANANYIAESNGVSWTYTAPVTNNTVYLTSLGQTYKYDGTSWIVGQAKPVLINGNTLGSSLNIGTNDNFDVIFKRNNITKASITSTGFAVRNAANTFQGEFQNAVTANRTWTMPDASGTVILGSPGAANRVMVGASATACNGVAQLTYSSGNMDVTFGANTSTGYTATNNASGGGGGAAISRYSCTAGSNTSLANLGVSFATVGLLVASQSVLSTTSAVGTLFANSNPASTYFKWAIGGTALVNQVLELTTTALTLADGLNIVANATTGTKIGTSTSQKLSLWNATPIVQPTTSVAAATLVSNGGTTITDTDTFDGYTIKQIVKALRNIGALA